MFNNVFKVFKMIMYHCIKRVLRQEHRSVTARPLRNIHDRPNNQPTNQPIIRSTSKRVHSEVPIILGLSCRVILVGYPSYNMHLFVIMNCMNKILPATRGLLCHPRKLSAILALKITLYVRMRQN